ncbi:hypothetical protein C0J52_03022 [Blattella germanica]|nr:hypothetical protein C0J52_03022 [Blattella germanica]
MSQHTPKMGTRPYISQFTRQPKHHQYLIPPASMPSLKQVVMLTSQKFTATPHSIWLPNLETKISFAGF